MADNDVSKIKVPDLKRELKVRGLLTTGNKNELFDRLQSADGDICDEARRISEDLLDDNDDVLNDDELDEETYLSSTATHDHDEDAILKSPQGSSISSKSPDISPSELVTSATSQQKRIVLKRKSILSFSVNESAATGDAVGTTSVDEHKIPKLLHEINQKSGNGANDVTKTDSDGDDRKVVKFSELTMKERLELRAKKFGGMAASNDALKLARAERFGISTTAVFTDLLKKRAERFGGSVSPVVNKIENKEKLQKRQERFGGAAEVSDEKIAAVSTQKSSDLAEKAKLRLERFKAMVK